jgi:hypothetical protein
MMGSVMVVLIRRIRREVWEDTKRKIRERWKVEVELGKYKARTCWAR